MNKLCKDILIIIMIIFVFAQIFFINKINEAKSIKVNNIQNSTYEQKTLKEFNEELNCLKEKAILSANEINGKWYIKIKIQGEKEELLNEVTKLENYSISDYMINKNKNENSIILEISSKESV